MSDPRRRIPAAVTLMIGLILGWGLSNHRPQVARAGAGDRHGEDSLTTGPFKIDYNERTKTQTTQEALYFLDWKGGRLLATVPVERQTAQGTQWIDGFVERDLTADFQIDVEKGLDPHFLMTPGSIGAYGEGSAPLFVFETTTKKVAVYKLQTQSVGSRATAKFELLEMKTYAKLPKLPNATP